MISRRVFDIHYVISFVSKNLSRTCCRHENLIINTLVTMGRRLMIILSLAFCNLRDRASYVENLF